MSVYYVANDKVDLQCYPNYSFEIGDINGDNKKEFVSLNQSGKLLRVLNLDGDLIFEKNLVNDGNWGTSLIGVADIDNDGRDEIIVPCGESIVAFDGKGNKIREYKLNSCQKDSFGICAPLLGAAKILSPNEPSIIAAVAGGYVVALDGNFNEIWRTGGFRDEFGHEIHFADIDGDGLDEIAFCTIDYHSYREGKSKSCVGDLVLLDHDGTVLLRKRVDDYIQDTHFDDIAMADFLGNGQSQILVEKGVLLDLNGNIIWDISEEFDHGQWIAHTSEPKGKDKTVFISELWGTNMRGLLFSGSGKKINDVKDFPWPSFDSEEHKSLNLKPLPSRCHIIRWTPESEPEIFLSQQAYLPSSSHLCYQTVRFQLKVLFMDLQGNPYGEIPFDDAQIKDYFYNGEVHSRVADVDGDGEQEIVFPKQDGHIMIIKKHIKDTK